MLRQPVPSAKTWSEEDLLVMLMFMLICLCFMYGFIIVHLWGRTGKCQRFDRAQRWCTWPSKRRLLCLCLCLCLCRQSSVITAIFWAFARRSLWVCYRICALTQWIWMWKTVQRIWTHTLTLQSLVMSLASSVIRAIQTSKFAWLGSSQWSVLEWHCSAKDAFTKEKNWHFRTGMSYPKTGRKTVQKPCFCGAVQCRTMLPFDDRFS